MLDHYTRTELAYRINCHEKTVMKLAEIGPGFKVIRVQRTPTLPRYVIKKAGFFEWLDAVHGDSVLWEQVMSHAPNADILSLAQDRKKWEADKQAIRRRLKPHEQRYYGRTLEDGKRKNQA